MRLIAIASLFVLAGTSAQADIICTHEGCWETGQKVVLSTTTTTDKHALVNPVDIGD
jgi:hypothetical protein